MKDLGFPILVLRLGFRKSVNKQPLTIIVRDDATKARAVSAIYNLTLEPAKEVIIRPYKVNLSDQQRKLYFLWCGVIGNDLGNTKDEMHLTLKKKFLVPIYEREHEGYANMMLALRNVYKQSQADGMLLYERVMEMTSIMDAKVSEMKEYLDNISQFAAELGIRLPVPDDLDRRAWHH